MSDRDSDRFDRSHHDRSHYQRDSRPQDSNALKSRDGRNQDGQSSERKSRRYQEEWTHRGRDRENAWDRGRGRRSRSPTRFGYHQEAGRLSPTPYEPAYQTDWRRRARDEDEGEDGASNSSPTFKDMSIDEDSIHARRASLEAQIAALTKKELSFEIDLLIQHAKVEAGVSAHPAQRLMEVERGDVGGDEMDVKYGRLGIYDNVEGTEKMEESDEGIRRRNQTKESDEGIRRRNQTKSPPDNPPLMLLW
ncbi:Actin-related protein 2 [Venturia nashicola]|nr:Actin-related protein 2 [Venturia nashicola]